MSLDELQLKLIQEQIRAAQTTTDASGTCQSRDTTGPGATVQFDGATVAVPAKVLGTVFVGAGDRCVLHKYGNTWVVTGSWSSLGFGECTVFAVGPAVAATTTSATFVDLTDIPSATINKVYDLTAVRFSMVAAAFADVASTRIRWALRITPTDPANPFVALDLLMCRMQVSGPVINSHLTAPVTWQRVTTMPAGAYTVQARWRRESGTGTVSYSDADMVNFEADEYVRWVNPIL